MAKEATTKKKTAEPEVTEAAPAKGARITKDAFLKELLSPTTGTITATPVAPAPTAAKEAKVFTASAGGVEERSETREKMSPVRKAVADNIVEAQQMTAMMTTFDEVDMSTVLRLHEQHEIW